MAALYPGIDPYYGRSQLYPQAQEPSAPPAQGDGGPPPPPLPVVPREAPPLPPPLNPAFLHAVNQAGPAAPAPNFPHTGLYPIVMPQQQPPVPFVANLEQFRGMPQIELCRSYLDREQKLTAGCPPQEIKATLDEMRAIIRLMAQPERGLYEKMMHPVEKHFVPLQAPLPAFQGEAERVADFYISNTAYQRVDGTFGDSLDDILHTLKWAQIEHRRDCIPWVFPLTTASEYNRYAPQLNNQDIVRLRNSAQFKENLRTSFITFAGFFGFEYDNVNNQFICSKEQQFEEAMSITSNWAIVSDMLDAAAEFGFNDNTKEETYSMPQQFYRAMVSEIQKREPQGRLWIKQSLADRQSTWRRSANRFWNVQAGGWDQRNTWC